MCATTATREQCLAALDRLCELCNSEYWLQQYLQRLDSMASSTGRPFFERMMTADQVDSTCFSHLLKASSLVKNLWNVEVSKHLLLSSRGEIVLLQHFFILEDKQGLETKRFGAEGQLWLGATSGAARAAVYHPPPRSDLFSQPRFSRLCHLTPNPTYPTHCS